MVAQKDIQRAADDVLLGASMRQVADEFRERLIEDFGFRPEEVTQDTFKDEVGAFMRALARHLGDRHASDARVGEALETWVRFSDHYEAWDALLAGAFEIEGRDALIRRGRMLFPGPLTRHWDE
ncbi:MAG: hypothetical protein VX044_05470 [Planctomycetota bacterium]|nr:hypothetical protein [Planctomycetota bacterium]MEC8652274.1 hypothetical protein [Planctomycetota bacterium]